MIAIEFTNLNAIAADLQRMSADFERRSAAVMQARSAQLVALTAERAPRGETGLLSGSVRSVEIDEENLTGFEAGWFSRDFTAVGEPPYYIWSEYGTVKMEARPALGPSWEEVEPRLIADLDAAFRESFR